MSIRIADAIDMHCHYLPKLLADELRKRDSFPRIVGGEYHFSYTVQNFGDNFGGDPPLAAMDRHGVGRAVLSLPPQFGISGLETEESLPLCRIFNNAISEICAKYPDRFSGYACLPLRDLTAALDEFKYAMQLPGMIGAILPGDGFISKQRALHFRPFFEFANQINALLFIHSGAISYDPSTFSGDLSDNTRIRIDVLAELADLASCMVTLYFTDFLDSYPNVTVVTHNLGGTFPFQLGRLDYIARTDAQPSAAALRETWRKTPPSEMVKAGRVLLDCNSFPAEAIKMAVDCYGPGRIIFATDGSEDGMRQAQINVGSASISDEEKHAIFKGTAAAAIARVKAAQPFAAK